MCYKVVIHVKPEDESPKNKQFCSSSHPLKGALLKVYKNVEVIVFTNLDYLYILCITVCFMPLKDLHFIYAFLILNSMLLSQVLHGQICLIPKDWYVSVIIL